MGLGHDESHLVFIWCRNDCKVLFSATRKGNGMSCHFSSDKRGLRHLKEAINEFVQFVFGCCKWCKMVLAIIEKPSVERLVLKCGFDYVVDLDNLDHRVYMRARP
jgi:hypothetical protein